MDERAHGIVLRVHPMRETSLIIRWLTLEFGRIATVARGALRAKSPFRGKLDLFYMADFSFSRSRRSELHNLRETALAETHPGLREELVCLRQAAYGAALIEQTTEIETPIPEIFHLLEDFLRQLCGQPAAAHTLFAFELKLLSQLGLKPHLAGSPLTAGAKRVIELLIESNWHDLSRLKISREQTMELRSFLHGFLIFHLGKIPASRGKALQFGEVPPRSR